MKKNNSPTVQVRFPEKTQHLLDKLDRDSRALGFKSKSAYIRMLIARGVK